MENKTMTMTHKDGGTIRQNAAKLERFASVRLAYECGYRTAVVDGGRTYALASDGSLTVVACPCCP